MTRTHFIKEDECLIAFNYDDALSLHDGDFIHRGKIETVEDVVTLIEGEATTCFKIVRFNIITNDAEDIGEQVAEAYLDLFGYELEEECYIPPFIEKSDAWDEHIAELAREAADDARYGSYEQQNRLKLNQLI